VKSLLGALLLVLALPIFAQTQKPKEKPPAKPKRECDPTHTTSWGAGSLPEMCSSEGKWIVDGKLVADLTAQDKKKGELIFAARSRVLTVEEFKELKNAGPGIFVSSFGGLYREEDNEKKYNALLLQQFEIQQIAREHQPSDTCKQNVSAQ
jgi:hypothetical protein